MGIHLFPGLLSQIRLAIDIACVIFSELQYEQGVCQPFGKLHFGWGSFTTFSRFVFLVGPWPVRGAAPVSSGPLARGALAGKRGESVGLAPRGSLAAGLALWDTPEAISGLTSSPLAMGEAWPLGKAALPWMATGEALRGLLPSSAGIPSDGRMGLTASSKPPMLFPSHPLSSAWSQSVF
jgi:hypothetical protein